MLSPVSLAKEATIVMMMLLATFSNMEMTISARQEIIALQEHGFH